MTEIGLAAILERLDDLPSISPSVSRIMSILDSPDSSTSDLTEAIRLDQSLTAKVLRMVNSVFFGFPRRIDTLDQAVTILGFRQIQEIVLVTTLFEKLEHRFGKQLLDTRKWWRHAIGCGLAAALVAKSLRLPDERGVFLAGLLHDVGKVILCAGFYEEYGRVLEISRQENLTASQAEDRVFGVNHTCFGRWLEEQWNLPPNLTAAVTHHHHPTDCRDHYLLVCLVHLGDIIAHSMELESPDETVMPAVDPQAWVALNMSKELLAVVVAEYARQMEQTTFSFF